MSHGLNIFVFVCAVSLINALPPQEKSDQHFIQLSDNDAGHWMSETQVQTLIKNKTPFLDVTNLNLNNKITPQPAILPKEIKLQESVKKAISNIKTDRMEKFLADYAQFYNRFYQSKTGAQAGQFLLSHIANIIQSHIRSYPGKVTVRPFLHPEWLQMSSIVRFEGSDNTVAPEVIILGAHMDSINRDDGLNGEARGVNDNGSGTVVLLEVLQTLLETKFVPKRSIELQWYAAEEVGLRGSLAIAQSYYEKKVKVAGMVNFDIVGYPTEGKHNIAILTDNSNEDLRQFLIKLVKEYATYTPIEFPCGYGCTDHVSYTRMGFPASSPVEPQPNPVMHTTADVLSVVDYDQLREFVKLGLGAVIEIGEAPVVQKKPEDDSEKEKERNGAGQSTLQFGLIITAVLFCINY